MKYYYFVSFMGESAKIGNISITTDKAIKNIDDIRELEKYIKERTCICNVSILNYKLMRKTCW